jgi:hypothetical protein
VTPHLMTSAAHEDSAAQAASSAQRGGKAKLYAVVGAVVIALLAALYAGGALRPQASVRYLGSPSGYEGFVPNGQTVNYNGQTDPVGDLILSNGTTLHNTVWDGQYSSTIIQNHNQIVQLNNQFVGQTDPVNNQPYVPLQDFYVIKGISFIIFFLIIFYIIVRRLRPRKFRIGRIYKWTAIYILLILFLTVQIRDLLVLLSLPVAGILGYILGLKILERGEIRFFYKNGTLYYKWPTSIIVLWSGLFIIRLFLELLGSKNIVVLSIVDLLLSFSTGLIVSASSITVKRAKQFLIENVSIH